MKLKIRKTRLAFTPEEKRKFYEVIKGSARSYRNKTKYHRPSQKSAHEVRFDLERCY